MKKVLTSTALTLISSAAFAQDYSYDYYGYVDQIAQSSASYYTNETTLAEQAETQRGYMPVQQNYDRAWDLSIMVGAAYSAEYKGANDQEFKMLVAPKAEYRLDDWQKFYLSLDKGLGYAYALTNNLELGGGLGYRQGRDSSDASILTGMDDVDDTATLLAYANYKLDAYNFGIKLEKGLDSSNDGFTTELSAGYKTRLSPKLVVGAKAATIYADDTYMEQNFGVSAADAIAGRAAHKAEAGFSEASLKVYSVYNIDGPHNIMGSVKYTQLLGDAKDSTITEDDNDIAMAVGYSYSF